VAAVAGPRWARFGCWRRMAFFGDTLAHSRVVWASRWAFYSTSNLTVAIYCFVCRAMSFGNWEHCRMKPINYRHGYFLFGVWVGVGAFFALVARVWSAVVLLDEYSSLI